MTPNPYLWLIPILPLAGAAINGFFGRQSSKKAITAIALIFCGAAFCLALLIASSFSSASAPYYFNLAHWLRAGSFQVDFSFYLDQLSLVMLLVVTGVGFLIHIYSVGYMWEDDGYYRFMSYMNLFMFFMLTLVLAKNYLVMFIGWEGVGLASYLLIGFWFTKDSAAAAGKKAFIVNRIGDFGFLIALFLMIKHFGSLDFTRVFTAVQTLPTETAGVGLLTAIGLLLMVGAAGKSAQIPLYVWLPDAMEGPTPVSALIHAATMVTAGVYMVARSSRDLRARAHGDDGGRHHWNAHRSVRGDHRHCPDRHQESAGLLHRLAARLHVHGLWRGSVFSGHLPPDDARVLQGPVVPGGRFGHSRHRRRTGHAKDGRAAAVHALDLLDHDHRDICDRRLPTLCRIFLEGRDLVESLFE